MAGRHGDAGHVVFTYGTLKEGEPNYYHINETDHGTATLTGRGHTARLFPLVVATRWNLPFLLHAPGQGHHVEGDVYHVDDVMLAWMDEFEGHPDRVYTRTKIDVVIDHVIHDDLTTTTGGVVACWVYALQRYPASLLRRPTMACYTTHAGLPYQPDEDLDGPEKIHQALENE